MAKYTGHEVRTVKPQLNIPQDGPEITEDQVASWWETFSTSVPADEVLGVSFEEGKNLYYFSDTGDFVRAVNEGEDINSREVQKRLLENSLNGRLFTRANEDMTPRQVVTYLDEGQEPEVGVAESSTFSEFTWTPLYDTKKPEPLPFWKYLLWPFSSAVREEIKTHRQQTAEFDANYKEALWIERTRYNECPCIREDRQESYNKELAIEEQEYELRQKERAIEEEKERIRAEKEAADKEAAEKEAFRNEWNQKKQEWDKDVGKMPFEEYEKYRNQVTNDANSHRNVVRDIVGNKHATYDDVFDGVVRMMEMGLIRATSSYYFHWNAVYTAPTRIMVQQKPYQEAKAGLREYTLNHTDEKLKNLINTALEKRGGQDAYTSTSALVEAIEEMVNKFVEDDSYFTSKGLVTKNFELDTMPNNVKTQAERLRNYRQFHGTHITEMDDSPEGYRKQHEERKARWDQDVSKMTPEEFMQYREELLNHDRNQADYFNIVTHPHATIDDVYDFIARDMEVVMMMEQTLDERYDNDLTRLLKGRVEGADGMDLRTEFAAVQRDSWQKVKESMHKWARQNVSKEKVQTLLNNHVYEYDAKWNFGDTIRTAYNNVKGNFRTMGVIFKPQELTQDVLKNMLVEKYRRVGPEGMKDIAETLKQHLPQQPTAQQPTVQQPQVTQSKPKQEKGREV